LDQTPQEQPSRTQCQKVRVKTGEERASKGEEKQSNKFQPNTSSKSQIKSLSQRIREIKPNRLTTQQLTGGTWRCEYPKLAAHNQIIEKNQWILTLQFPIKLSFLLGHSSHPKISKVNQS